MANLVEVFYKKVIRPYQYTILLISTTILFSVSAYYAYEYYFREQTDVANRTGDDPIQIYLFHVDWCPHCQRAMPEWSAFKQQYHGKSSK